MAKYRMDVLIFGESNCSKGVKEIIEFWNTIGFGYTNVNSKEHLLYWLEDSSFLQPKEMFKKTMILRVPIISEGLVMWMEN
jgi:hypothetical protein